MTSEVPNEPASQPSEDAASAGITRRGVVRAAGAGALVLGLGGATGAAAQPASAATRKGPGSVAQAPDLPPEFTSRFIHANGLRQHVVIGGDGPPLLLVHGWPQFWYQFRLIMPGLARDFQVIAPDQRGRGLTSKPPPGGTGAGYDTGTLADDLAALMDALGHQSFSVVGCDTGMDIAYALAADHRDRVAGLAVAEAPLPGICPRRRCSSLRRSTSTVPPHVNRLPTMNVELVRGREDLLRLCLRRRGLREAARAGGQGLHRRPGRQPRLAERQLRFSARSTPPPRDMQRAQTKLTVPVLAIGGAEAEVPGPGTR